MYFVSLIRLDMWAYICVYACGLGVRGKDLSGAIFSDRMAKQAADDQHWLFLFSKYKSKPWERNVLGPR